MTDALIRTLEAIMHDQAVREDVADDIIAQIRAAEARIKALEGDGLFHAVMAAFEAMNCGLTAKGVEIAMEAARAALSPAPEEGKT